MKYKLKVVYVGGDEVHYPFYSYLGVMEAAHTAIEGPAVWRVTVYQGTAELAAYAGKPLREQRIKENADYVRIYEERLTDIH